MANTPSRARAQKKKKKKKGRKMPLFKKTQIMVKFKILLHPAFPQTIVLA